MERPSVDVPYLGTQAGFGRIGMKENSSPRPPEIMVTVNDILDSAASTAYEWFQSVPSDCSLSGSFNWHGLADCSVTRSRKETEDSDSLLWARIATTIYDRLSIAYPDATFDCSSMFCRTAMIARHGVREGCPVLDPSVVFDWFRDRNLSLTETMELLERLGAEPWSDNVVEVLRPLRQLKNHLNVIHQLAEHTDIADDVDAYRPLRDRLP